MKNSSKAGFTLVELLVVIVIIGILAAVAVPQYQKAVTKARFAEAGLVLNALWKACALHELEHGEYACSRASLEDLNIDIPGQTITSWFGQKQTDYFVYKLTAPSELPAAYYNPHKIDPAGEEASLTVCLYVDEEGNINCSYMEEEGEKICKHSGYPVGGEDNGYCW